MKKLLPIFMLVLFLAGSVAIGYVQSQEEGETTDGSIVVLHEAKEQRDTTVAVDARLTDNIMEVTIIARMRASRPNIYNAIIVGPKLGRLAPEARETLLQTTMEDEPFPTKKKGAFINFSKKVKTKKAKGRLTRELEIFDIPRDRIVKGKKYKLWVQVKSMQEAGYRQKGNRYNTFKFDLEDLPELLEQTEE